MVVLLSRLKGVFRKSLNCHPSIVNYVKRPVVGNLPGDLLSKLISANPSNKRDAIVGVQDVFSDASKVLGEVNTLDSQGIMRTSFSDLINNTICKTDYSLLNWWKSDSCYQEKELEILLKAEETLLKGLKKYLPEVANVKFAPIGEGAYSNVYKLEIFDVNTNKIIDDKTIKVYREKFKMITDAFSNKVNRFLDGTPDEEVYRTIKPFENKSSLAKKYSAFLKAILTKNWSNAVW